MERSPKGDGGFSLHLKQKESSLKLMLTERIISELAKTEHHVQVFLCRLQSVKVVNHETPHLSVEDKHLESQPTRSLGKLQNL